MTTRLSDSSSLASCLRGVIGAGCLALALLGCGSRPYDVATPSGFVDLSGDRYSVEEYRATTADGLVLGARSFENDPKAELAFVVKAIENKMRRSGGYALLDKKDLSAQGGLRGTLIRFGHDEEGHPHLYLLGVFVNDKHVFVLEAGGTKEQVEASTRDIDTFFASLAPK